MAVPSGLKRAANNQQATDVAIDMPRLVHEHHAAVYRYACRLCGSQSEAEDVTQQTFLIAQQRLAQLREVERARGWLLAVARSCFLKTLRHRTPKPAQDVHVNIEEVVDRSPAAAQVDGEALHMALAQLPDEFRLVLLMYYFEELPYQEIAEQLDLPIGTVMSRLSRAKGHLRKKLSPPVAESRRPPLVRPAVAAASFVTASPMRAAR